MNCTFCSSTNWLTFSNGSQGVKIADFMGQPLVDLLKRILKAHPRTELLRGDSHFGRDARPNKLLRVGEQVREHLAERDFMANHGRERFRHANLEHVEGTIGVT